MARYVTELDRALVAADTDLRRWAFGRGPHRAPAGTRRVRVPLRVLRRVWRVVPTPRVEHLVAGCDVVHATDLAPPPTRLPLVMTVHDLDALLRPDLHDRWAVGQQRAQLAAARTRAHAVIADSEATADALRAHGVDAARITVVRLGVTPLPDPDTSVVPADTPYLLAVGSLDARKGLDCLVRAFASADLDGILLVIAGPEAHRAHEVTAAVSAAGVADRVVLPGRVTDAQLAALYRHTLAYCLPSRAEGFGLPLLEAMNEGAAVLASDLPVLREIGGEAVRYLPVDDVDAWATGLHAVVSDDAARAELAAAGPGRAARFTWEATARETLAVYERVTRS